MYNRITRSKRKSPKRMSKSRRKYLRLSDLRLSALRRKSLRRKSLRRKSPKRMSKSRRNCKHGELKSPVRLPSGGMRYCKKSPKRKSKSIRKYSKMNGGGNPPPPPSPPGMQVPLLADPRCQRFPRRLGLQYGDVWIDGIN